MKRFSQHEPRKGCIKINKERNKNLKLACKTYKSCAENIIREIIQLSGEATNHTP